MHPTISISLFATATAALGLAQFWLVPALRSGRRSGPG